MNARILGAALALGLAAAMAGQALAQTEQPGAEQPGTPPPTPPAATAQPAPPPPPPDTVVAVVDGKKITRADVIASAQSLPEQYRQNIEAIFPALIDRLVDLTLLSQAGRKQNLQDDPEVKTEVERLTDQVIQEALIRRHLKEAMTDEALKARYDKFVAALPPQTEVRAAHILVDSEDEAKGIIKELDGGADFATLAKSKSKDPSAKENGGDLGYFVQGQMVPEFSKAAFELDKGQTSKAPVKTQFGWHVIKVEDKRPKAPPTLDEARGQIEQILSNEIVTAYLETLRGGATVEKFNPDGTPIAPKPVEGSAAPQPPQPEQQPQQ
ncbi:MAG TPA: peptidylprolyl isomerase [Dongiaceae bacterium]|jgi:peptidyl-prolyl cis-trans isomerase C|nr:peptidylprolyl isomerase [Dongiaceae bacterium]